MISVLPAHRRAEEFATQVDGQGRVHDARNGELLELVAAMRQVEAPDARPDFVAGLRARLMAEADTALSSVDNKLALPAHPRSRHDRRIAVVAGTVALLGATSSVAVAAQGTLPGDTLYPLKRAIEGLQTSLTFDETARAETVLEQASHRLAEVEALALQINATEADRLSGTLDDFSDKADTAADLIFADFRDTGETAPLTELREFVDTSMSKLVNLDPLLPSAATDSLGHAAEVLVAIDDRITQLCPQCEGGIVELPARLVAALGSLDRGTVVDPTAVELPTGGDLAPNQAIDPDEVVDLPLGGATSPPRPPTTDDPTDPTGPVTEEPPEAVKKTTTELDSTLRVGNKALLGEDGLLGPVVQPLDPLLGEVLGDDGLLSD